MTNEQVVQVIEHFKGKPVNDDVIREYCNLNGIPEGLTAENLPDHIVAYEYEQKVMAFQPKVLETLLRLRPIVDYVPEKVFQDNVAYNKGVWLDIISYAEDAGFSPEEAKNAIKDVMKTVINPFVEAEKKIAKRETDVLEILLTENGGNTLKNISTIYSSRKNTQE